MQEGGMPHEAGAGKSSLRRIAIMTVIMVGVAALSFLPSLFSRGGTGYNTGFDITDIFIPVWLTLTVGVVIICFYFFKDLVTAERNRDSEAQHPVEPVHQH